MPSVQENIKAWGDEQRWSKATEGNKWSLSWGNAEMQWYGTLLPRIQKYLSNSDMSLKVDSILEIAPGYGRWTQYLRTLCNSLMILDLNENCIEACQEKFANFKNITYHVNDGKSLSMVPNGSIDFVFSHDSLVHAEIDVVQSYLSQLSSKLKPNGVAFLHHSNLGNYVESIDNGKLNPHWRGRSVTAEKVKEFGELNNLRCLSQELFNWGNRPGSNIDCFSVFTAKKSEWDENYKLITSDFKIESSYILNLSYVYS